MIKAHAKIFCVKYALLWKASTTAMHHLPEMHDYTNKILAIRAHP